jgi:hypothetical protein
VATLTVISWRDIPAQVVAKEGRRTAKAMLGLRFQVAIDRAATRAGKKAMDDYLEAEAAAEVARIEQTFTRARLTALTADLGIATGEAPGAGSPAPETMEAP